MFLLIKHFAYITVIFSRGANNFKRMEKIIAGISWILAKFIAHDLVMSFPESEFNFRLKFVSSLIFKLSPT